MFQGQEAAVVMYSVTSSSREDAPRGMRFLFDPNRFNVATSRAHSAVIVVGNPRAFAPECKYAGADAVGERTLSVQGAGGGGLSLSCQLRI